MHIRHLAMIRKNKTDIHIRAHTHKYIFKVIMTSRTLQESQHDWDSTEG